MLVHYRRMKRATGVIFETAWSGFALNLLIYFLLSHILGACWYLFTLHRVVSIDPVSALKQKIENGAMMNVWLGNSTSLFDTHPF